MKIRKSGLAFLLVLFATFHASASTYAVSLGPQVVFPGGSIAYEEDKLTVHKTAMQQVENNSFVKDTFDITLQVSTTQDLSLLSGVARTVLVLDVSNSMEWDLAGHRPGEATYNANEKRFDILKRETKKFADEYAQITGPIQGELALVLFNTDAAVALDWGNISDPAFMQEFDQIIDGLSLDTNLRNGKKVLYDINNIRDPYRYEDGTTAYDIWTTNYEAAITLANKIIVEEGEDYTSPKARNTFVVVITDGKPTRRGGLMEEASTFFGLPSIFGAGLGSSSYGAETMDKLQSIITTSHQLRKYAQLYCIFLATNENNNFDSFGFGQSKLYAPRWFADNDVATATMFASDQSSLANDLQHIVERVEELIEIVQSWVVTDKMGEMIAFGGAIGENNLIDHTIVSTTNRDAVLYFDENDTLYWDLKKSERVLLENGEFQYSFPYRIKLRTDANGFMPDQVYPTGTAVLSYKLRSDDVAGDTVFEATKTGEFMIPTVKAEIKIPEAPSSSETPTPPEKPNPPEPPETPNTGGDSMGGSIAGLLFFPAAIILAFQWKEKKRRIDNREQ